MTTTTLLATEVTTALDIFNNNSTTASPTTEYVTCNQVDDVENACVIYSLPAAIVVVAVAAFFRTRRLLCLNCCQGRPAVAFPMDLVEEHERKWSYAAVFGVLAYRALRLMDKNYYWQPPSFTNPEWSAAFGFSKVIVGMLNVVHICFIFYPLLVCIRLRRIIVFNVIGFLYNALWLGVTIVVFLSCAIPSGGEQQGSIERVLLAVFDVPVYICHVILIVTFILDFAINLSGAFRHKMLDRLPIAEVQEHNNVTYVKSLLKKRACSNPPTNCVQKLIYKLKYIKVAGLAYSPRVICTMVVAAFGLFKLGINMGVYFDKILADFNANLDYYAPTFDDLPANDLFDRIHETFYISRPAFAASNAASLILHYFFIAHIIICYRRNLLRYLRGDKSWHFNYSRYVSPAKTLVLCMRYSGYQIAFLIYGWLVLMFFIFFVIMLINFTIIVPLNNGQSSAVINKFKELWPTIVLSILMLVIQILIAKFCFLQDRNGRAIALDNKRWFHVASYFLFFFNILLGIFSALRRFILSVLLELCLMSRLDKVLFMRGVESMDTGFSAYLSMLMTEEYLCHPVMRCFVHLLNDAMRKKQLSCLPKQERRTRVRNRWLKALTLARNPSLVIDNLRRRLGAVEGMRLLERSLSSDLPGLSRKSSVESIVDWTYFEKRGDFIFEITRL